MTVYRSVPTWRQPLPPSASAERAALLGHVTHRILACGPARLRVAVDGRTSSGKTTFGHELAGRISRAGRPVLRATPDDFKRPWRDRRQYDRESGEGYYRNAFDYEAARSRLLEPAGPAGSESEFLCLIEPRTQQNHSHVVTRADAVLVVDGVFAFRPEIDDCW